MRKFLTRVRNSGRALAITAGSFVVSAPAFAQGGIGFDATEVTDIVTEATTFITTVGLAVLVMLMIAKGVKWARKAG